jgi:ankyrin repeat protein
VFRCASRALRGCTLLLSRGVDVDPINYFGTPLHLAGSRDQGMAVKILLEHGADVSC